MDRIFLDTSYLKALFFDSDFYHDKAVEISKIISSKQQIINSTVLIETLNKINKYNKNTIQYDLLKELEERTNIIYLNETDLKESYKLFLDYDRSINYSDCTILYSMIQYRINKIVSFDSDFKKIKGLGVIE